MNRPVPHQVVEPKWARACCHERFERALRARGYQLIAGVDEAGRGCLCGAVYAAAVVLSPDAAQLPLRDSKQLTSAQRERLADLIRKLALGWSVAWATAEEIDRLNILEASRLAMRRAVEGLSPRPDFLLVDAMELHLGIPERALIKGDARCRSIAAASILAKVARDAAMRELDRRYPVYGLARNKGYATPEHLEALRKFGPCPEHRLSFAPVRAATVLAQISSPPSG